jgi:hypothetical protein
MIACMQAERFSVTVNPVLGRSVREAAAKSGLSVSKWVSRLIQRELCDEASERQRRSEALRAALDAWHAEDGPLTDEELAEGRAILYGEKLLRPDAPEGHAG